MGLLLSPLSPQTKSPRRNGGRPQRPQTDKVMTNKFWTYLEIGVALPRRHSLEHVCLHPVFSLWMMSPATYRF